MICIPIGNKKYKGIYRWNDITLSRYCELAAILMPPGYEAYILADGKFDYNDQASIDQYCGIVNNLSDKEINEDFPEYYRKVIKCLTNIPWHIIENMSIDEVNSLYEYWLKPFVVSILYHIPIIRFAGELIQYEPEQIKTFRIGLSFYYLPQSVKIGTQEIPLANEPIISYSEASDIFRGMKMSKEDIRRLALFMAIYCRKHGERYDEKNVLKRQELFMRVPMSTVWYVFFYTCRRIPESLMIIRLFGNLPRVMTELRDQVRIYSDLATVH